MTRTDDSHSRVLFPLQGQRLHTKDPPLVIVDLVSKARCVCHCQLQLQSLLLNDSRVEEEKWKTIAVVRPMGQAGSLTMGHRVQLQGLWHG